MPKKTFIVASFAFALFAAHEARAQDALTKCTLKGSPLMAKGLKLHDSASGGREIAEFIGGVVPLAATISEEPSKARSKVSTSAGKPTLRIDGWLDPGALTVFAVKDVPAVGEQVKIAGGYAVKPVKGSDATLTVELAIAGSFDQTLKGSAGCDSFSLDWSAPRAPEPPETAKMYLMKGTALDIFEKAGAGDSVFTLSMSEGASPLLWALEYRGMFVRVMSRSDVVIDGWVKLTSLTKINKGDRIESPPTAPKTPAGARMVVEGLSPRTASKDIPVRARADEKERTIGVLERGAQFYVVATSSGWSNVLPQSLTMAPPDGGGFWIPSDAVPK